jgi:signal transduction histidine kinase/ActR/RegA family two-component response regulator
MIMVRGRRAAHLVSRPVLALLCVLGTAAVAGAALSSFLATVAASGGVVLVLFALPVLRQDFGREAEIAREAYARQLERDVAERTRELETAQQRLAQSQKLEAIGRLAGGIAHDFNNLLTVIAGRSAVLIDQLGPEDGRGRHAALIHQSAERAAALTRQLLAFGRRQILQPTTLDLNAVAGQLEPLLRRLIGENIDLRVSLDPALGPVRADASQIEQVIMNLVVNARDAMPGGGQLTLTTADTELDEAYARRTLGVVAGPHVLLSVTDTGTGMDADTRARIFEPFFTTKEPGLGTGLGLATVYGIVKQSGGHISVYSEPGRGTTFKVFLPRVAAEPAAVPVPARNEAPAGGHETILLVEDEPEVRALAREILERLGYAVLAAGHPGEVAALLSGRRAPIDLLLTDVVMPHMSGRELADIVLRGYPEMRVLYMSGYTDDAIVHHGVLDPGTAFLPKPFSARTLAAKVREVLDAGVPARA